LQVSTLCDAWKHFLSVVEVHHTHEEELIFPWMTTRVTLPPKLAADHQGLLAQVPTIDADLKAVRESGLSALAPLAADYAKFKSEVEAHFAEEEQIGLALMRAHFSAADYKTVAKKQREKFTPPVLAWFVWPLPDDAARRDWLARVMGLSDSDITRVYMPAIKKHQSEVLAPIRALIDGAKEASPKAEAGCACVVM
jgi:hypothetical protein